MKSYWISSIVFGLLFAVLFSIRLDLHRHIFSKNNNASVSSHLLLPENDTWMNIFQNGNKIGCSHKTLAQTENGYQLQETVFMRINTMDFIQELTIDIKGDLNPDLSLSSFDFKINSGLFSFAAEGTVSGNTLRIITTSENSSRQTQISIKEPPFLAAGVLPAVRNAGLGPGDTRDFKIFDPSTMSQEYVSVKMVGKEDISIMGKTVSSTRLILTFKGATQSAWIGENGELLKESGLLGITLEKTNRFDACSGIYKETPVDLVTASSIPSNVVIKDPYKLEKLTCKISGINVDAVNLDGGRQALKNNVLTIYKDTFDDTPAVDVVTEINETEKEFLKPTPFIQSDHPEFRKLAREILSPDDTHLEKAKKLISWINENIEKRPVLSVPDALSVVKNRVGDCNEHSVLLAALARSSGIPAKIEAGLVYLDGRFYYHAWNLLYVGHWITADAALGQIPADVTHIRFASGSQKLQLDLMRIIDKIQIEIIEELRIQEFRN